MSWTDAPQFYDGVDEPALKLRFIELLARYPAESPLAIGAEVFKGSCDALEACRVSGMWAGSLEVREAVREYARTGGHPKQTGDLPTKEELAQELLMLARNPSVESKERVASYKTAAEVLGYITKQVDKKETKVPRAPPTIIFKRYEDAS